MSAPNCEACFAWSLKLVKVSLLDKIVCNKKQWPTGFLMINSRRHRESGLLYVPAHLVALRVT